MPEPLPHGEVGQRANVAILIVDDHDVVTWGFRFLLTRQSWVTRCLQARSAQEAIAAAERFSPHLALVDLELGQESGTALLCTQLRAASPGLQVLLLADGPVPDRALKAAGAAGFVSKCWHVDDTVSVIRAVGLGLSFHDTASEATDAVALSGREQDVLARIATGATNREIAAALHLSPHTVKQHASAAFKKLNARNRTDAVQRARRLGFVR